MSFSGQRFSTKLGFHFGVFFADAFVGGSLGLHTLHHIVLFLTVPEIQPLVAPPRMIT